MNWVMKGFKEELKALKDFRAWMFIFSIIGIGLFGSMLGMDLQVFGVALVVLSIILFIFQYHNYKEVKK